MTTRTAVAIYARISQDRDGAGLGIERQLMDCRAEAERLGWTVAEEYVDDDISAYSGKRRPAYERMLDDIAEGYRDAVLAWHIDRLHRRPIELEELERICTKAGVTDLRTVHGAFNLSTGDGMLVARLLSAVAANESDSKRRRGRRKMQELAEAGRPHGGGTRPFGFLADKITHHPDEADTIRTLAARALAGESLGSLVRWLSVEGISTVTGKDWRSPALRTILLSPRIYGMRSHQGEALVRGQWEPIITPEQGEALRVLLTNPERKVNRAKRRYVLSGLCRCHRCGSVMVSVPKNGQRRYLCRSGADFTGCGRMAVYALPVEQIIEEAVLQRLDGPEIHDALAGRARDDATANKLHQQIAEDGEQLKELANLYAQRAITAPEWLEARNTIETRQKDARRRLSGLTGTRPIDAYIGQGEELRQQWTGLNLDRQRAIIEALVEYVEILPGKQGARSVAVERVRPVWRL